MSSKRLVKLSCKLASILLQFMLCFSIGFSIIAGISYRWVDAFITLNIAGLCWYSIAWLKSILATDEFLRL